MNNEITPKKFTLSKCFYISWFFFLLNYRKTILGPLWIIAGPMAFILVLGGLYSEIGAQPINVFMPHMVVGFVTWTIIGGVFSSSPTTFRRARSQILQGGLTIWEIVVVDIASLVIKFVHQTILIIGVLICFKVSVGWTAFLSIIGLGVLMVNAVLYSYIIGILGARYKDVSEIMQSVMRLAFLATPIIWIPSDSGRGGVMAPFLSYNPFYHFVESVRAPLLGELPSMTTVIALTVITIFGLVTSFYFSKHLQRSIALWI